MEILRKAAGLEDAGNSFMLATVIAVSGSSPARPGFRMIVTSEGKGIGTIGGGSLEKTIMDEAKERLAAESPLPSPEFREINLTALDMECGGKVKLFIEYYGGRKNFILFGGGHVGRALAAILVQLGFSVTIYDNRPEVAETAESDGCRIIISDYADISEVSGLLKKSRGCFIATQGHEWDRIVLSQVIRSAPELGYIGMIGSKRKVKATTDSLIKEGLEIPANLYAPVGLRIGGDSASEIAVSVAAEIIAVGNGLNLSHMRGGAGD